MTYSATIVRLVAAASIGLIITTNASAQNWVQFSHQTPTRLAAASGLALNDPEQKAYAWGDVDRDGDIDLVIARKIPFTFPGGKRNVLLLNEGIADGQAINGVLVDRTNEFASSSINVPQSELDAAAAMTPPQAGTSNGFLDLTNDHDIALADVNNDGWLDIITATGEGNVTSSGQPYMLPRFLGHPRVYINQGASNGQWQGFVYDYALFPQLFSKTGVACNPRFNSVAVGDVTGDGFADLYFADFDSGEVGPNEGINFDMDNKLIVNLGAKSPGSFADQTIPRLAAMFNYGGSVGFENLAFTVFAMDSGIADMNGDGLNDLLRQGTLQPQHISSITNNAANPGQFATANYEIQYQLSGTSLSAADLNNDDKTWIC